MESLLVKVMVARSFITILEMYPESILKAVAHGGCYRFKKTDYFQLRAEQQLHVVEKFLSLYPESKNAVTKIVRQRLCYQGTVTSKLCGADLIYNLTVQSMVSMEWWPYLNDELKTVAETGESKPLSAGKYISSDPLYYINYVITHVDIGPEKWANCYKVRQMYLRTFGEIEPFALSECWAYSTNEGLRTEEAKKIEEELSRYNLAYASTRKIRQNLEIYPDIEFHLFSSQLDYYTPNAIAAQTAAEIGPRVQFHRLKDSTHDAFAVETNS